MIELRSIYFSYSNKDVLKNVSVVFSNGITVVVGPNGAGKTTMLKVASCIYRPRAGQVLVNGMDFWLLEEARRLEIRREIVYVHEVPAMLNGSVLENVCYGLRLRGVRDEDAEVIAMGALERLGVAHLAKERARDLSVGHRYRVAVARAISVKPKNLLLDEPAASLDSEGRRLLQEVLLDAKRDGVCIAISTHDRLFALEVADNVVLIEDGKIVKFGKPEEVLTKQ